MKRFKDILCVVAPGAECQPSLEYAVTLAENNQASLTVIDVVERVTAGIGMPGGGPISADLQVAIVRSHEQELDSLIEPYRQRLDLQVKVLIGTAPFLEIIREVLHNGRDLVIKTAETCDWQDRLFCSDDMHLFRKCPCPVWLIKPEAPKSFRRILAAVDVNDWYPPEEMTIRQALNRQILEMAGSLAFAELAEFHVVHACKVIGESSMRGAFMHMPEEQIIVYINEVMRQCQGRLDALLRDLGQDALDYPNPQTHLVKGEAHREILALAKDIDADLIVMGTVGRTGLPGFFIGNTAETILNQIDCSVLAIKPPNFITPVTLED